MTVGDFKTKNGLKLRELAAMLGCSKGHAHDLCTGRRAVTLKIAHRLGRLTGRPYHEFLPPETEPEMPLQYGASLP